MNPVFHSQPSRRTLAPFTQGSVLFMGANFQIDEDNASIFWDDTNKRLGINDNTPTASLFVQQDSGDLSAVTAVISPDNSSIAETFRVEDGLGNAVLYIDTAAVTINIDGLNFDFRIRGQGVTHLLYADVSADGVGIGTNTPGTSLDVRLDSGTPPAISADTIAVFTNASAAIDNAEISIIAGASGNSILNFGDTGDANSGFIDYDHAALNMEWGVNTTRMMRMSTTGVRIDVGVATDPRVELDVPDDAIIEGTLFGSSSASGVLQLESTNNATKGTVDVMDELRLERNLTTVSGVQQVVTFSQNLTVDNAASDLRIIDVTGTWTHTTAFTNSHKMFRAAPILTTSGSVLKIIPPLTALSCVPTIRADQTGTTATFIGYDCNPAVSLSGGTFVSANNPNITAVACAPNFATGVTTGNFWGMNITGNAGAGTFNDYIGIRIPSGASTDPTGVACTIQSADAGFQIRHLGPAVFGANAAPTNSSVGLEVQSTTLAFLLPRMTTTQRDALTAVNGMVIYNTTTGVVEAREGGAWVNL